MTTTFTGQAGPGYIRAIGTKRAGGSRIFNSTVEVYSEDDTLLILGEGTSDCAAIPRTRAARPSLKPLLHQRGRFRLKAPSLTLNAVFRNTVTAERRHHDYLYRRQ